MEKIFSLISVFVCISFFLMLHGFEFLPLVILLLYVGSIAVLFLFVVIIINPDLPNAYQVRDMEHQRRKFQLQCGTNKVQQDQLINIKFQNLNNLRASAVSGAFFFWQSLSRAFTTNYRLIPYIGQRQHTRLMFTFADYKCLVLELMITMLFSIVVVTGWYCTIRFIYCFNVRQNLQVFITPQVLHDQQNSQAIIALLVELNNHAAGMSLTLPQYKGALDVIEIGKLLYQDAFGYALLIVGLILLIAMVGVILLTVRRQFKIRTKMQNVTDQAVRYRYYFRQ
jgi:NADH:ubiquinone oxidoreductase subunit 6 (subunit J)